ncbi:MAG: SCO family protein [Gemmatimonadales bacterium]|nr:SCO family protein [Gemmatimonadales bacterium]
MSRLERREVTALAALATILGITGIWWALALWPLPGDAPTWLVRTRAVCFGAVSNGLPTTAGWMVLIGQPVYMLATLWLISGQTLGRGLRTLGGFPAGRAVLRGSLVVIGVGLAATGVRIAGATTLATPIASPPLAAADVPRLNRGAPPLELVDQRGRPWSLAMLRGRPAFVTFAFAHCETVCPVIVHEALQARRRVPDIEVALVIVTLDPWRDTPSRLPSMAARWGLGAHDVALSDVVADVERTLDAWEVGRSRDVRTGEVAHAPVVYLIDRAGRIAYRIPGVGDVATLAALAREL